MLNPTIIIPPRVATRPRDPRGYPIPYLQLVREGERVDFRVMDTQRRIQCLSQKLCGICGQKLDETVCFIGGEQSVKNRLFSDPASHEECARFSMQACPYLSNDNYRVSGAPVKIPGVIEDVLAIVARPKRMGLYITTGYRIAKIESNAADNLTYYFYADPAALVEWF